ETICAPSNGKFAIDSGFPPSNFKLNVTCSPRMIDVRSTDAVNVVAANAGHAIEKNNTNHNPFRLRFTRAFEKISQAIRSEDFWALARLRRKSRFAKPCN